VSEVRVLGRPLSLSLSLSLIALGGVLCACNVSTDVGATCTSGECATISALCEDSEQQLPEFGCSGRNCNRVDLPPDPQACGECNQMLAQHKVGSPIGPCACAHCATQLSACFASQDRELDGGDPQRDQACQAIVECGWASGCSGSDCYCGVGVDRNTCLQQGNEGHPAGPCAGVIEAAVTCDPGVPRGDCLFAEQLTVGSVLNRATEVAKCVTGDPILQGAVIKPMCPVELLEE
jgi:hypothetical protein